jgi:hypothetical protein
MSDGLNFAKLAEAWDAICPPPYYAIGEYIEPGKVLWVSEGRHYPEYIVCHPDDLEMFKRNIVGRRLAPLQDWRPA